MSRDGLLDKLHPQALRAAMVGGTDQWGQWGSSEHHVRYMQPAPSSLRRRCHCGCKTRASFSGMANGICLITGCELRIRRWVKTA